MEKELISIIITTYKRPELICSAVNNCLHQSYGTKEIIVVDDNGKGSPFQTKTAKKLNNYIVTRQIQYVALDKNGGACAARNYGGNLAQGKFIAFFDDDDEWTPDKIALQYEKLAASSIETAMVLCGQKAVQADNNATMYTVEYSSLKNNSYKKLLNNPISFATPNPLIRKEAFDKIGGFATNLPSAQDLELGLRILKSYKLAIIEQTCLISKIHPGERISTNHAGKIEGLKYILTHYETDLNPQGKTYYWQRVLMHCFYGKIKEPSKEATIHLKKLHAYSFKYMLFYKGITNLLLRRMLIAYLRRNNALY